MPHTTLLSPTYTLELLPKPLTAMSEATRPKYDNLPGIDTAPDIYETPDLAEDVSTVQASTVVSEDDNDAALDRQRFQTDQARSRFQPSRVDAQGVDFSDNIAAQRRSYRTSTRDRRRRGEILGHDSDDENEAFIEKLARVKREAMELQREYNQGVESGNKLKTEEMDPLRVIESISNEVDSIYAARRGGVKGPEAQLDRTVQKFKDYKPFEPSPLITKAIAKAPPLPGTQIQKGQLDHVLSQAADFDKRITELENSLGLNGNTMPDISPESTFPVFTQLKSFEQTLSILGEASANNLDGSIQHIKKLTAEAEQLKATREDAARSGTVSYDDDEAAYPDREAKINALYGTLPAIDKLSPILPIILERLRTLRLIHTSAWQADEVLDELELRQSKQENEIMNWQKQLEIMEKRMKQATDVMHGNMKTIGTDVKNFEARVEKLLKESPTQ